MNRLQRDLATVRATYWWEWAMHQLEERKQRAISRLIIASDSRDIYALQGEIKAIRVLTNILTAPPEEHKED